MAELFFFLSSCTAKVSVLLFYRRILSRYHSKVMHWAIRAAIWFTVVYTLVLIIVSSTTCTPVNVSWLEKDLRVELDNRKVECSFGAAVFLGPIAGTLSVISDFYAVCIPWWFLRRIRFSETQQRSSGFCFHLVFILGLSVGSVGILRTYQVSMLTLNVPDFTSDVLVCSVLEASLGCICASLPATRAL
ncbi:hypothetical protein K402DRAFT_321609, partial [Aulographum hederae CBS 113979]